MDLLKHTYALMEFLRNVITLFAPIALSLSHNRPTIAWLTDKADFTKLWSVVGTWFRTIPPYKIFVPRVNMNREPFIFLFYIKSFSGGKIFCYKIDFNETLIGQYL